MRPHWSKRAANYFGIGSAEGMAAAVLLILLVVLKLFNIAHRQYDSDEPQHMHIVWAWARGLVPYRDLFDNHMPLFHILLAPIFSLIGDRPDILLWMRLLIFPLYFLTSWCVYQIGTLLFSRRVGLWAAILNGLFVCSFCVSLEFRTDNLWMPLWLLCLVLLLRGGPIVSRALAAGLVMGLCFAVSLKSILFLLSVLVGAAIVAVLVRPILPTPDRKTVLRATLAFLGASVLIPGIVAAAFARNGLWSAFRYGVLDHNTLSPGGSDPGGGWRILIFLLGLAFAVAAAKRIVQATADPIRAFRRGFIFLVGGFYLAALYGGWRFITRQDFLPWDPLAGVFVSAGLVALSNRLSRSGQALGFFKRVSLPALVASLEFVVVFVLRPPWQNGAQQEMNVLRDVLALTGPADYVVDSKGESIFRQRAFWPVMESITLARMHNGLLKDETVERSVENKACVAVEGAFSDRATRFIQENYLPIGDHVRAVGVRLAASAVAAGEKYEFPIVIGASYKVISPDTAQVTGWLDDRPYNGEARLLAPGSHTFVQSSHAHDLVVLWARAVDRHFTPFPHRALSNG